MNNNGAFFIGFRIKNIFMQSHRIKKICLLIRLSSNLFLTNNEFYSLKHSGPCVWPAVIRRGVLLCLSSTVAVKRGFLTPPNL